jgi:hypothetical protein
MEPTEHVSKVYRNLQHLQVNSSRALTISGVSTKDDSSEFAVLHRGAFVTAPTPIVYAVYFKFSGKHSQTASFPGYGRRGA